MKTLFIAIGLVLSFSAYAADDDVGPNKGAVNCADIAQQLKAKNQVVTGQPASTNGTPAPVDTAE